MKQPQNPTAPNEFPLPADTDQSGEPGFRDFLRFATAEIKSALEQGRELQKEIDARRAQINEAIARPLAA
jgi:hypothetical protein